MKIWQLFLLLIITFVFGYMLRMYQHPINYQTEQERYENGWYKEKIMTYVAPDDKIKTDEIKHIQRNKNINGVDN